MAYRSHFSGRTEKRSVWRAMCLLSRGSTTGCLANLIQGCLGLLTVCLNLRIRAADACWPVRSQWCFGRAHAVRQPGHRRCRATIRHAPAENQDSQQHNGVPDNEICAQSSIETRSPQHPPHPAGLISHEHCDAIFRGWKRNGGRSACRLRRLESRQGHHQKSGS